MLSNKDILTNLNISKIEYSYPQSGQKQVFLVRHKKYGKVILKIVCQGYERVKREIEIVNRGHFAHVPKVIEVNDFCVNNDNGLYIFEEYIDGESLKDTIAKRILVLNEAMDLTEQLLQIIVEMEKEKVVHRDIKPANIIHKKNGEWFLIDFGIARALDMSSLTMTEVSVGPHTPGYGAPELFQYSKKDIDSRSDLFSLGVVVFESLTGKHPFVRGDELDRNEIWYNTVTIIPESIVIDGDKDMKFIGLIQTFMQKHATRRPRTAEVAMRWFKSIKAELME